MKKELPVVKQMYRLNVEPRVVDQLAKLATRSGEPKTRLATRLFTDAVMGFKVSPLPRQRERSVRPIVNPRSAQD
jgi:hypothetical protein